MTNLELRREVALEIGKQWASHRKRSHHRAEIHGPDGGLLNVLQHDFLPLLLEKPIPSRKLDGEVVRRVAFERIALKVKLRRQISAFLRPIGSGDDHELSASEILDLDSEGYPRDLDETIERIYKGQQQRALIARQRTLMAHLGPPPPLTLHGVPAVSRDELADALRNSAIPPDQLESEVRAWLESWRSAEVTSDERG